MLGWTTSDDKLLCHLNSGVVYNKKKMPEKYFAHKSSIAGIAEVSHKDLLIYMYTFHISTKQRPQQTLKVAKWNNKIRVYL